MYDKAKSQHTYDLRALQANLTDSTSTLIFPRQQYIAVLIMICSALMLGPNRVIAKTVKICTYCSNVSCTTLIVPLEGLPWP